MASVKALIHSPNQSLYHYEQKVPLAKSHSFPGTSSPQTSSNHLFNRKTLSESFDFAHRRLSVYMLQLLTPITTSSSIFDCYSYHSINNLDISILPSLETSVDSLIHREITMPSQNNTCPVLAPANSLSMQLPCCPDTAVPSQSLHYSAIGKENRIMCSSVSNSNKSSVSEESIQIKTMKTEIMESVSSSSLEENKVLPYCSYGKVILNDTYKERNKESAKSSSCDYPIFGYSQQRDGPSNSATQDKIRMFGTSVDGSTPGFALIPKNNLALVLSAPRKIVKKGRPSSKKQKKRKREKGKRESSPLQTKELSNPSQVNSEIKQSHPESGSLEFASVQSHDSLHSTRTPSSKFKNNHDEQSTPVIPTSRTCPSACLIFRLKSSSEEVDVDDIDEWSVNENSTVCMSPFDSCGFNFALTLDSIFKKANIHESVSSAKENGTSASFVTNSGCQNLKKSLFKSDSYDDSDVEICASPVSTQFSDNNYITHMSGDLLFPAKHCSKNQTAANLLRNSFEFIDDHSSPDNSSILSCAQETDFETLDRINAQWNEHYPSIGVHSCNPGDDVTQDTSTKVHFAAEPHLLTVHILEEEERGGPWQHFAADRERFERRILDLERIISPVLDADHRVKILEHRLCAKTQ